MKRLFSVASTIIFGIAVCNAASADILNNGGGTLVIPDGDPTGVTSVLNIAEDELITDVDINLLGTSHDWVGDLIVRITSPNGTTADIMFETGQRGGLTDSSDMAGDYTFSDGGDDWWAAADAASFSQPIPNGVYQATTEDGVVVSLSALFAGEMTAGDWTLFAADNSNDSTGSFQGWGLAITSSAIPEPGSLALLSIMGAACVLRRRR